MDRRVRAPAILAALLLLAACGGGGGSPTPAPSPLLVLTSVPPDGAQDVPVDASLRVVFTKPLDPASVRADSLRVGVIGGAGEIPGITSLLADGAGQTLVWEPSDELASDASHTVIVSEELRSAVGDAVSGNLRLTFRTEVSGGGGVVIIPPRSALRQSSGWMFLGRRSHAATLLEDGRVLVTGGFTQGTSMTASAEVYNPALEVFTTLSVEMALARAAHTATRLDDGRVLICGGWREVSTGILDATATAEIYNPDTGLFSPAGLLGTARADHTATLLPDGRVLIAGGSRFAGASLQDLASMEVFDPLLGTFTPFLPMASARAQHAAVTLGDGRVLLAGGNQANLRHELFDPLSDTLTLLPEAAADRPRFGCAAATFASGAASIVGGDSLGSVLYVDGQSNVVLNSGSGLTSPRSYGTATRIGPDRLLVAGGIDVEGGFFILATLDLIVERGLGGSQTYATSMRFDTGLALHTATTLQDGRVLFCGGLNAVGGSTELSSAYLFVP